MSFFVLYIWEYLIDTTRFLFCVVSLRVLGRYDQISVLCSISKSTLWIWLDLCFVLYICEYLVDMSRALFCVVYLREIGRYDQISVKCCISESAWWIWPDLCFMLYIWEYIYISCPSIQRWLQVNRAPSFTSVFAERLPATKRDLQVF